MTLSDSERTSFDRVLSILLNAFEEQELDGAISKAGGTQIDDFVAALKINMMLIKEIVDDGPAGTTPAQVIADLSKAIDRA